MKRKNIKRYKAYKPLPGEEKNLPFHKDTAPGTKFLLATADIFPGSDVYITLRRIKNVKTKKIERYFTPHMHKVDSYFLFFGDKKDLSGLEVILMQGNKKSLVKSPASVYIPAGTIHWHEPVRGSGYMMTIVLRGDYRKSF